MTKSVAVECLHTCSAVVQDEGDKVIVCERGDLVFVFNFNPNQSFSDYGVGCRDAGSYKVCSLHTEHISLMSVSSSIVSGCSHIANILAPIRVVL